MNINLLIVTAGVIANILLGLFVFVRNRRSATHVIFFLLSLDIAIWSTANFFALQATDVLEALYWTRIVMALAVPQAVLFFLVIHTIPNKSVGLPGKILIPYLLTAGAVAVLCLSPFLFTSLIFVNGSPSPTPGPAMPLFVLVAIGSVIAGIITLFRKFMKSRGLLKLQLRIIGIGIIVMFLLIVFFNFILVVFFQESSFISFSPFYTLPFVGATAYTIIRHKFLDINLILARTVSYTVLISLFGIFYALIFSLVTSLFISPSMDPRIIGISTVAALLMVLTFPGLKRMIEKATDALLFKDKYDAQEVLFRLSNIMARTLRFEDVTHQFLTQLNAEMHIQKSNIIIIDNDHVFTTVTEGYGRPPEVPEAAVIHTAKLGLIQNHDDEPDEEVRTLLEALECTVIIPLTTSQRLIGLLGVGTKQSGEMYTSEDINMLSIIAPEVAVAIENALSYEEIHRFNITLEDEVERATTDLRKANTKLEELDKLKDEFVSLASHELRTPLTVIRSYVWMALSGKGGEVSEKQKYYLERSFISTNRLIKLVNSMLNISRIESGRMAMQLAKISIDTVIQSVLDDIAPKLRELGLTVSVNFGENIPPVVADSDKVLEVLMNFIGNAMKFTPRDGTIRIDVSCDSAFVRVAVTDTGMGIEPENLPKLFMKFGAVRLGNTPEAISAQSTGLGLYISKSIITMHGGAVEAASEGSGKGATFSFTLPVFTEEKLAELQHRYGTEGLGIIHSTID